METIRKTTVAIMTEALGGGILSSLANTCLSLDAERFDITLVYSRRAETPPDEYLRQVFPPTVKFVHIQGTREISPAKDARMLYEYWKFLRRVQPDVVHLHSSKAGFIGRVACKLAGMRHVFYSPRGYSFLRSDIGARKNRLYIVLEKVAHAFGGTTVAVSRSEAESAATVITPERVVLVENAIDHLYIRSRTQDCRRESSQPLTIGTVGRISPQKDPDFFLAVAQRVVAKAPHVQFLWIGGGELASALLANAAKLGLSDYVACTGWVTREDAWNRLNSEVDVYVQTSRWEGMPLTVLEAMALGKPVVVNDCVGNRDVVNQGVNGFVVSSEADMAERVLALLADSERRAAMGERGRKMVETRFSIARLGKQLAELYESGVNK